MSDTSTIKDMPRGLAATVAGRSRRLTESRTAVGMAVSRLLPKLDVEGDLRDHLGVWLTDSSRSPQTARTYFDGIRRWVEFTGAVNLAAQIATVPSDVVAFLDLMRGKASPRTIATRRVAVQSWFSWLISLGIYTRSHPVTRAAKRLSPIDRNRIERGVGVRQSLELAESTKLAIAAKDALHPWGAVVALMLSTGIRTDEVTRLQTCNVIQKSKGMDIVITGKGGRTRVVSVEPWAQEIIRRYLAVARPKLWVFERATTAQFLPISTKSIYRWTRAAIEKVLGRTDITPHDLRKTHATLLMDNGCDIRQVSKRLGHSSVALTETCYTTRHREFSGVTGITTLEGNGSSQLHTKL